MYLGAVFHSVQQIYFDSRLAGETLTIEDLWDAFDTFWVEGITEEEIDWGRDQPDNLAALGRAMVKSYYPYAQRIKPLLVEQEFSRETEYASVHGKLDLITTEAVVIDYKSSSIAPKKANVDNGLQPTVYSFLLGGPTSYQEHYIMKWKVPKVQIISTTRTKKQIDDFQNFILPDVARMVQAGIYPPLGAITGKCKRCLVREICKEK